MKPYPWIVLDNINLGVHEFGHLFFGIFGSRLLTVWGGTLMQMIVPLVFLAYFAARKDTLGGLFCLWWVGHNLINISVYLADATCLCMPLLGGDSSGHDWLFLLSHYGKLSNSANIAKVVKSFGQFFMLSGLFAIFGTVVKEFFSNYEISINNGKKG